MKRLAYLIVPFLLVGMNGFSQESSIEYVLPNEVEEALENYLSKELSDSNTDKKYYCVIRSNEKSIVLSVQSYEDTVPSEFMQVIKSSNRYISIASVRLPVIFEIDFLLIAYGTDSKGRPIRKRLIYERPFKIEFDSIGRIISTGF